MKKDLVEMKLILADSKLPEETIEVQNQKLVDLEREISKLYSQIKKTIETHENVNRMMDNNLNI